MNHYPWPSIEQFKNVRRNVEHKAQFKGFDEAGDPIMDRTVKLPTVLFVGTTKCHGTNAGIVINKDSSFYCQSRERIATPENDNAGFARWVTGLDKSKLDLLKENFPEGWERVAVYGEWIGKGIQNKVAISQIEKCFVIFGAKLIKEEDHDEWLDTRNWTVPGDGIYNIYNYPTYSISIDFEKPEYAVDQINKWVLEVEQKCPVGEAFGVSGIGEGLVFKSSELEYQGSKFWFKAKGSAHSESKVKKFATVDIEKFESNQAFINSVLDEERLEQGFNWLKEMNHPQDESSTGHFIRWVFNDVLKENKLEMETSGIIEKDLGKLLSSPTKKWYFARMNSTP